MKQKTQAILGVLTSIFVIYGGKYSVKMCACDLISGYLAQTADGESVIHEISRPYPRYTHEETQKKYIRAARENKPVTCAYIREHLCFDCGRDCGVKAPVTLVHREKQAENPWKKPIPFEAFALSVFVIFTPESVITALVFVTWKTWLLLLI